MRGLPWFLLSVTLPSLALAQVDLSTRAAPEAPRFDVSVLSAPQLGHVALGGEVALGERVKLGLGGWNVAERGDRDVFLRGGWLSASLLALKTDGIEMYGTVAAFGARTALGAGFVGGLKGAATTHIEVFRWFSVVPEFELSWLGPLTTGRLSNTFEFHSGHWRLEARGGVLVWARDQEVNAGLFAEGGLAYRWELPTVRIDAGAGVAVSQDASVVTGHPVFVKADDSYGPWGYARVSVQF
jgi:hypothetical protein